QADEAAAVVVHGIPPLDSSFCTDCRLEGGQRQGPFALRQTAPSAMVRRAGPVAQLDRALPSEGRGREFESRRVRHLRRESLCGHARTTGLEEMAVPRLALCHVPAV